MNVVLITNSDFPFGSAWSSRARGFVKLFCSCGYHVHIIAPDSGFSHEVDELKSFDYSVEYVNYKETFLTLCGVGATSPFSTALLSYLKKHKVSFVFSSRMPFAAKQLSSIAHSFGSFYILEQCEWFHSSSFKGGILNPYYRKNEHQINVTNFRIADGIVAISRLLEDHYSRLPVIRIPTILDTQIIECSSKLRRGKQRQLVFAGNIGGKKELLLPIFEALSKLYLAKDVLHLDIYGPNEQQVLENISENTDIWNKVCDVVAVHGRIPQQQIEGRIREADYSIFIRPQRRSSNAGFPTKLAESMAVGTPVITNNTGDVGLYMNDSNGYLLGDSSSDSILKVLLSIISQSIDEAQQMRLNARKKAEEVFDYRNYVDSFKQFIESIEKRVK